MFKFVLKLNKNSNLQEILHGNFSKRISSINKCLTCNRFMVFNNKPGISEATRELVMRTAAQYGYTGKSTQTAAASRVIQLINYKKHGKIAADTPFFSQLTEGITQECYRQNAALHISYFYENMDIPTQLASLKEVDCIGILLLATEMGKEDFKKFKDFHVPIVVLDCYYDELK